MDTYTCTKILILYFCESRPSAYKKWLHLDSCPMTVFRFRKQFKFKVHVHFGSSWLCLSYLAVKEQNLTSFQEQGSTPFGVCTHFQHSRVMLYHIEFKPLWCCKDNIILIITLWFVEVLVLLNTRVKQSYRSMCSNLYIQSSLQGTSNNSPVIRVNILTPW